jgi:hypothetical protein
MMVDSTVDLRLTAADAPGRGGLGVFGGVMRLSFGGLQARAMLALGCLALAVPASAGSTAVQASAPTAQDWANLAKLPDWTGVWTPAPPPATGKPPAHAGQWVDNEPQWTPAAARQIAALEEDEKAGRPHNIYVNCLPEGMPSFMIMTLNALEFLFTPGRVTILGEFDGNRLRRIFTDGRPHPTDPDLTFNGHSIGHWEGGTLVVDTVAILPEVFLPLGQGVGLPNNGDMHIVEHIRLTGPDLLQDDLLVSAPHMLQKPWAYTRKFKRHRGAEADIVEASCRQGDFVEQRDAEGNAIFAPLPHDAGGAPLPLPPGK